MKRNLVFFTFVVLTAFNLHAQDNDKHSINIRPLPFLNRTVGINYEYLVAPKHGIVFDTKYRLPGADLSGYSAGLSWRNHTKGGMGSFFWGVFTTYSHVGSEAEVTINDVTTDYPFEINALKVGLNLGKRFLIEDSGFNFTLRGGYGYPILYDFSWTTLGEPDEVPNEVDQLINGVGKILSGFDLELSFGYSF